MLCYLFTNLLSFDQSENGTLYTMSVSGVFVSLYANFVVLAKFSQTGANSAPVHSRHTNKFSLNIINLFWKHLKPFLSLLEF